jgi:hypothetical protein
VPAELTVATLVARLTNVVVALLGPVSVGVKTLAMSTMRIFSLDEPKLRGARTEIPVDPDFPSLVAVMLAAPGATPVTKPAVLTVATPVLSEDQVTNLPTRTFPPAPLVVAVACVVLPTPIVDEATDTVTEATGSVATVTAADPLSPSLVAVMLAVPALTPVTTPALLTVAADELSDDQDTARPVRTIPFLSVVVAVA